MSSSFNPLIESVDGRALIESSAGTGKTYTIASLYLRLLVEKGLKVGEILVVTFTKAATEELKGRIRQKIRDAVKVLDGEAPPANDDFIREYCAEIAKQGDEERKRAAGWLASALTTFDEASIFTIHGFCGRVLKDNAFESSSLFDTELETDDADLLHEIAADFYRAKIHGPLSSHPTKLLEDPLKFFERHGLTPRELEKFIRDNVAKPFLSVIPGKEVVDRSCNSIEEKEAEYFAAWEKAFSLWRSGRDEVLRQMTDGRMNGVSFSTDIVNRMFKEMDGYAVLGPTLVSFREDSRRFHPDNLKVKNGFEKPSHAFFAAFADLVREAESLETVYGWSAILLRHEALEFAEREMAVRKRQRNIRFYDDLLQDLRCAVNGPAGQALRDQVQKRYKVALIDEFQDTDLMQYEVFDSFFPEKSTLFLIGDPKQAIYSFRGADIFAYIKASRDVARQYSLGENFRSTSDLVKAVNALFMRKTAPFEFEEIVYPEVKASSKGKSKSTTTAGKPDFSPLKFWVIEREAGATAGSEITKDRANAVIPPAVASEIVRLLEGGRKNTESVDGDSLKPSHIAVLVRTNRQAGDIHEALKRRGVPAVIYGTGSVFTTLEAEELHRVLSAVVSPGDDRKVRAALATVYFGVDGNELERLKTDVAGWAAWTNRFAEWRKAWSRDGFVAMTRSMMNVASVRRNLLSVTDGERRLTNLLHLFELLQDVAHRERIGAEGLVQWLARRRGSAQIDESEGRVPSEENQVRLETDEDAVKVITIHKSKGLEYPIVFCPYLWDVHVPVRPKMDPSPSEEDEPAPLENGVLCHDPTDPDRTRMVRDFGSDRVSEHIAAEAREGLSENARMLYVALTRARYRCIVVWGALKNSRRSALGKLLHIKGDGMTAIDDEIWKDLEMLAESSGQTVEAMEIPKPSNARYAPSEVEAAVPECRSFSGKIDRTWGVSSFTGLTRGAKAVIETPDHDGLADPSSVDGSTRRREETAAKTSFTFPRGAKAGTFFHKVMETVDFAGSDACVDVVVSANLRAYGFDEGWRNTACAMVRNVLSTPIDPDDPSSVLSSVAAADRRHEVDFALPLGRLTKDGLKAVFPKRGLERLEFHAVQGLMKGSIDLVFRRGGKYHLLDWKTNHLGGAVDDYGPEAMAEEMESALYFLQYHIYSVALDRYLALRIPDYDYETHFGGVYYLFVRGMDPAGGAARGVFRDRPSGKIVSELRDRLFGEV